MPEEILDGVYDITVKQEEGGRRFRAYLLTDGTPTLFDCGFADSGDAIQEGIEEIGVEPERLVITHEDPDHSGGFDAVVDRYNVETWVPAADADAVDEASKASPDHRYGDGDSIGRFTAVHVPGHTPGLSVLIDEDRGIAVTGDAVNGSDFRGLPAGYLIPPPEVFSDDLAEAERSLDNLLGYEFDVALVYHGSAVLEGASEKLEAFVNFPGKPSR